MVSSFYLCFVHIDSILTNPNRDVVNLEFWEESTTPTRAFYNVLVVLEIDRIYKRMRIEIFEEHKREKLASGFGMCLLTLILKKSPDNFCSDDFFCDLFGKNARV